MPSWRLRKKANWVVMIHHRLLATAKAERPIELDEKKPETKPKTLGISTAFSLTTMAKSNSLSSPHRRHRHHRRRRHFSMTIRSKLCRHLGFCLFLDNCPTFLFFLLSSSSLSRASFLVLNIYVIYTVYTVFIFHFPFYLASFVAFFWLNFEETDVTF